MSWQPGASNASVGRFSLSGEAVGNWNEPFVTESMDGKKKQAIAKAVMSAPIYLQLVEAGRIRPKRKTP